MVVSPNVLVLLDILFSLFFVGPFTVLFWRGTFVTIHNFFISGVPPSERWVPAMMLYGVGLVMKIFIDLVKHCLKEKVTGGGTLIQGITKLIIIYMDALFGVVLWAGGFNILYYQFPDMRWYQLLSVFLVASTILFSVRAFKCMAGTPLVIVTDSVDNVFSANSYFKDSIDSRDFIRIIQDTVFSYAIVHSLVIAAWWGFWELENKYILLPCEIVIKDSQAWDSVVIAFILAIFVFSINGNIKRHVNNRGSCSTIMTTMVSLAAFLASLNFWRGFWSVFDFYFFPQMSVEINLLLSHVVGFLWTVIAGTGLTLTMSSSQDSPLPEYNYCQFWSGTDINLEEEEEEDDIEQSTATENTPILGRIL